MEGTNIVVDAETLQSAQHFLRQAETVLVNHRELGRFLALDAMCEQSISRDVFLTLLELSRRDSRASGGRGYFGCKRLSELAESLTDYWDAAERSNGDVMPSGLPENRHGLGRRVEALNAQMACELERARLLREEAWAVFERAKAAVSRRIHDGELHGFAYSGKRRRIMAAD